MENLEEKTKIFEKLLYELETVYSEILKQRNILEEREKELYAKFDKLERDSKILEAIIKK